MHGPTRVEKSVLLATALLVWTATVWAATAEAKDVSFRRSWVLKTPAQTIVDVLTDYAHYCDEGCKYRYPSVKKTLVLPFRRTPSSFYVWTFVEDIKNSEWFSHVTVKSEGNRTVVTFAMVTERQGKALERKYGKPHDPVFDRCITRYDIREISRDGKFQKTHLTFSAQVSVSGLISLFSGAVHSGLEDTAEAILRNILSQKSRRPGGKSRGLAQPRSRSAPAR